MGHTIYLCVICKNNAGRDQGKTYKKKVKEESFGTSFQLDPQEITST